MKNKSKLAKIKSQNKVSANIPDGWFLMSKEELAISRIYDILGQDYDVEIWTDAGVAEITIGEKSSIDVELLEADLKDEYSNDFLSENGIKSLFYLSFKKDSYEQAKPVLKKLADGINGFICGDTDDFFTKNIRTIDMEQFELRTAREDELNQIIAIEQICFPPNEACSPENLTKRMAKVPELFLVAVDRETGKIAGFLNGVATDEEKFRDDFFTNIDICKPDGKNVMLLGLDVLPIYRRQGLARAIVEEYCRREKENGRKKLLLTCLDGRVKMYLKFGFKDHGIADSTWGGEKWHEMSREL